IGEQTPERHHDAAGNDGTGDEIVIARGDRVSGNVSHARPSEHFLDEEGPPDERREGKSKESDHREKRVAQRVLQDNRALADSLCARGTYEVLGQHVEQGIALISRDAGGAEQREGDRRQYEVRGDIADRSEERRVGKEGRWRWSRDR